MQSAEAAALWGTDDDRRSGRSTHMLGVDVTTGPATSDPITAAEPVIASVAREPGYRELGLTSGTLDGRPADSGSSWLWSPACCCTRRMCRSLRAAVPAAPVLASAAADAYASLSKRFAALRRSLAPH